MVVPYLCGTLTFHYRLELITPLESLGTYRASILGNIVKLDMLEARPAEYSSVSAIQLTFPSLALNCWETNAKEKLIIDNSDCMHISVVDCEAISRVN